MSIAVQGSPTDAYVDYVLDHAILLHTSYRNGKEEKTYERVTEDQARELALTFLQDPSLYNSRRDFINEVRFTYIDQSSDSFYNQHRERVIEHVQNTPFLNAEDYGFAGVFEGNKIIKEKHGKYIYTPSSYYCGLKVIAKIFNIQSYSTKGYANYTCSFEKLAEFWFDNVFKPLNPKHPGFTKVCLMKKFFESMPDMYLCIPHKHTYNIKLFSNCNFRTVRTSDKIFLTKHHKGVGHLSYAKDFPNEPSLEQQKEILEDMKIEIEEDFNLKSTDEEWFKLSEHKPSPIKHNNIIIFDIETHTVTSDTKSELYPYSTQYQWVDLTDRKKPSNITVDIVRDPTKIASIKLLERFLIHISSEMEYDNLDEIQVYAHNGGAFDYIFFKGIPNVKFLNEIKIGNKMKQLTLSYRGRRFILKDSFPFINMSLKNAGIQLKISDEYKKKDFDIVALSYADYFDSKYAAWKDYAVNDIHALREIIFKLEDMYSVFGESITNKLGVPGIAWNIMHKSCDVMRYAMYYPKDQLLIKFIKSAMYGGRVFVFKRKQINCIGIDMNSLYPSVMSACEFPIGIPHTIDLNTFNPLSDKLYIINCTLLAPNVQHAIHPHRTVNKRVIYPSNQYFTGSYSSVEIKEMLTDGYIIKDIYYGIEWNQKARIFEQTVNALYEIRKQYKQEGNAIELVIKLILNSIYGKFLESVDTKHEFISSDDIENFVISNDLKGKKVVSDYEQLINGQYEVRYNLGTPEIRKPVQIGVFVLSYARALVNKVIRLIGIDNISYSDTDSLYLTYDRYQELQSNKSFTDMIGNNLCQFKNDYGTGVVINYGIFLDQKRYFLKFGDTCKAKFNGMTFGKPNQQYNSTVADCQSPDETKIIAEMFNELIDNYDSYQENELEEVKTVSKIVNRLVKSNISVFATEVELKFAIGPDKKAVYDKASGEYYAIGFDISQKSIYRSYNQYFEWYKTTKGKYDDLYECADRLSITSDGNDFEILSNNHTDVFTSFKFPEYYKICMTRVPQYSSWVICDMDLSKQPETKFISDFAIFQSDNGYFTMNPITNTKAHMVKIIGEYSGYLVSPSGLVSSKIIEIPTTAKYIIAKKGRDKEEFKYEILSNNNIEFFKSWIRK